MIKNLIRNIQDFKNKTNQEICDILNEKTEPIIDEDFYTWAGVASVIGPIKAEELKLLLEQHGLSWVIHQLGGRGIQLNHPSSQYFLENFTPLLSECALLKNKGISFISKFTKYTNQELCTIELVNQAIFEINTDFVKEEMRRIAALNYNNLIQLIEQWDGSGNPPVDLGG
jgi:hypothetical protein